MEIRKITNRNTLFSTLEEPGAYVHMAVIMGTKHNFIIDTGIGGECAEAMLNFIGNDPKPIIVINTHHDWDHAAGNWAFKNNMIIAHKLCYKIMDEYWDKMIQRGKDMGRFFKGETHKCLPNLLFDNCMYFPEEGINIFHTPGHTEDGISVYDEVDKVLHVGDNFGVSEGKAYYWGAKEDIAGFRKMVETYKKYNFEVCLSGHSEPQTREVMGYLETALAEVEGVN